MIKQELKKLFIKQYAILAIVFFAAIQCILLSFSYKDINFSNEFTKENYFKYMDIMRGELNAEKEQFILNEQEKIQTAETDLKELQRKLYSGEITTGSEYNDSMMEIQSVLNRSEAFEMIFNMYKYARKAPQKRLIFSSGELGFCRDYPDVPMLIFVIAYSSINLLIEESSKVIVLIRSCEKDRKNTFGSKVFSLSILILAVHFLSALCEYVFLRSSLGDSINYPVQSLEYFGGCEYDITILQAFVLVQIIKLIGYFFILGLIIILSKITKKPVPVVSIPLAVCFVQQFAFLNPDQSYYVPTGLLRASGYFRGDAYETQTYYGSKVTEKVFSAVPLSVMICVVLITLGFIFLTYLIGYRYYKCKKMKFQIKSLLIIVFVIFCMTGCSKSNEQSHDIYFNLAQSGTLSQNNNYYFDFYNELSENRELIAVSKSDNSKFKVIRNTFDETLWADKCCIVENDLYFFMFNSAKSFSLYKVNLDTYKLEEVVSQSAECFYSFLGLKFSDSIVIDKTILSFFTDGNTLFLITNDNEVYECCMDLKNSECIIYDGIYEFQLVYTGEKIYYINNKLELIQYDIANKSVKVLSEDFARSVDLDKDKIIYSGNNGIYSISLVNNEIKNISDFSAERIIIDENKVVFSFENSLYLLNVENNNCSKIYDGELVNFNIIKGNGLVLCTRFLYDKKTYEQFTIEI